MERNGIIMVKDATSETFILEALKFLQLATDQYSRVPHLQIMRIKEIIEELEEVLEDYQ
jgi:hypothetical protein